MNLILKQIKSQSTALKSQLDSFILKLLLSLRKTKADVFQDIAIENQKIVSGKPPLFHKGNKNFSDKFYPTQYFYLDCFLHGDVIECVY